MIFPCIYLLAWFVFSILPVVYFSTKAYVFLLSFFSVTAIYYSIVLIFYYKKNIFFLATFALVSLLSIYGISSLLSGEPFYWQETGFFIDGSRFLLWMLPSLLSVIPVYVFTIEGRLNEATMKVFFFMMTISAICVFNYMNQLMLLDAAKNGLKHEEFAITSVYCFLSLFPLLILFKKKIVIQFALLCVYLCFFILGAKRGPIILGGICMIILINYLFASSSLKKKVLVSFATFVFFIISWYFIKNQIETSPYFAFRIEQTLEGYTSGRDEYGEKIIEYFTNEVSIKEFFCGIGAFGTLNVIESFAHNDWLAILLEQGVIGLLVYFFYWASFAYVCIKYRMNPTSFCALIMLFVIGFGKTMFSMYYLPVAADMLTASGTYAIVMGYFLGMENLYIDKKESCQS